MRRVWVGGGVSVLVAAVIAAMLAGGQAPSACDRTATTSTFAAQLAAATPGQVLCVAAGTFAVPKVDKDSPGVTVRPAVGVTRAQVRMSFTWNQLGSVADWLTFDGVTVLGSLINAVSTNITWRNSDFVDAINIDVGGGIYCGNCPPMDDAHLLFDHDDFSERECRTADESCQLNHGRVAIFGEPTVNGSGIAFTHNHWIGANTCGDGIQFGGHAGLGVLIRGNVFDNFVQSVCDGIATGPHIDPVQGVGSTSWVAEDNLLLNNSTGFVNYDGDSSGVVVRNNVIQATGDAICLGGGANTTIEHNTILSGGVTLCVNHTNDPSTNVTWRNNIMPSPPQVQGASSYAVNDYNLCTAGGCLGSHSRNRTPIWVDGLHPGNFAGFALAPRSPGKAAASDGTDIGVNP